MNETSIISFSNRNALSIHNEAMLIAKNLKSEYQKLFEILLVVERRQIYFEFEIPNLYTYCKELLSLSDNVAKEFGVVVRKSLEVPQLADAIRSGNISIYKARRISSVIDESNYQEWIDLAVHCSSREVEKTVALANPRDAAPESLKYIAGDVLDFRMGVSQEWAKVLERTKDLLSQQFRRTVSAEEATFYLMSDYCRKYDPLEKAKRAEERKIKAEANHAEKRHKISVVKRTIETAPQAGTQGLDTKANSEPQTTLKAEQTTSNQTNAQTLLKTAQTESAQVKTQAAGAHKPRTRNRPAEVEHQVDLRDGCQCAHVDQKGNRCQSRRWLQKHHIIEFANGGEHTVENLITLCWAHHKMKHLKLLNPRPQAEWHVPTQM